MDAAREPERERQVEVLIRGRLPEGVGAREFLALFVAGEGAGQWGGGASRSSAVLMQIY